MIQSETRANATAPAITIASRAPIPRVGEIEEKFSVSSLNGSAPPLILSARDLASSAVNAYWPEPPEMIASPLGICWLTFGAEIMVSSIQIEIFCPTKRPVASANSFAPSLVSLSETIYSLFSGLIPASAFSTSLPSRITGPLVFSRKVRSAVSPSSFTAVSGLKSLSPSFQGNRTIMRSLL